MTEIKIAPPNILFLDFDGPLFPNRIIKFFSKNVSSNPDVIAFAQNHVNTIYIDQMDYIFMDPVAVEMLNRLNDIHSFQTVISSTWGDIVKGRESVLRLFELNGLNLDLHSDWITPKKMSSNRIHEVKWWLDDHNETNWAVLDDPWSAGFLAYPEQVTMFGMDPRRCVIVNPEIGMEIEHHQQLQHIFNGNLNHVIS